MWPWVRHRLLGLALVAICAALWVFVVPVYVPGEEPSFFPRFAIAWIGIFAALTVAFPPKPASVVPILDGIPVEDAPAPPPASPDAEERFPSVYGLMALWLLYVLSIGQVGFYLSTFVMLAASMYYLGIRRIRPLILRPAGTLLIIYLLLDVALNFRLPEAFWQ